MRNITGSEFGTVDYAKQMHKLIYDQIWRRNKHHDLEQALTLADSNNDGLLTPTQVHQCFSSILPTDTSITSEQLELFISNLPQTLSHKLRIADILEIITSSANPNHNPFKTVI